MYSFVKISKFLRIIIVVVGGTLLFFIGIGIGVNIGDSDHTKSTIFYSQKNKKYNLGEREQESKGELKRDLRSQAQLQPKVGVFNGKQDVSPKKDTALLETNWLSHAVKFKRIDNRALVSIVLDDMGLNRFNSDRAASLRAPLTLSYLTYAKDLSKQTKFARNRGHELLIHLPMEPRGDANPGPGALMINMDQAEINKRLASALNAFPGAIGANNHMGSRFTSDYKSMSILLNHLKVSGKLFLDSLTTPDSQAMELGAKLSIPIVSRDVFLDDVDVEEEIILRLKEAEKIALDRGTVIAIGHARSTTLRTLEKWLSNLPDKQFQLAPLSAVAKIRLNLTQNHGALN